MSPTASPGYPPQEAVGQLALVTTKPAAGGNKATGLFGLIPENRSPVVPAITIKRFER